MISDRDPLIQEIDDLLDQAIRGAVKTITEGAWGNAEPRLDDVFGLYETRSVLLDSA